MAYHYQGKTRREYSLDFSVGESAFNVDDDVRLVQTLLHIVYFEPTSDRFRAAMPPLDDVEDVKVDGICGPITKRFIRHFKSQDPVKSFDLFPDAVLDPFRNNDPNSVGTRSGKIYAFGVLLIMAFRAQDEKGGSNFVEDLIEDERTHPKLKAALVATRKQPRQYAR